MHTYSYFNQLTEHCLLADYQITCETIEQYSNACLYVLQQNVINNTPKSVIRNRFSFLTFIVLLLHTVNEQFTNTML